MMTFPVVFIVNCKFKGYIHMAAYNEKYIFSFAPSTQLDTLGRCAVFIHDNFNKESCGYFAKDDRVKSNA